MKKLLFASRIFVLLSIKHWDISLAHWWAILCTSKDIKHFVSSLGCLVRSGSFNKKEISKDEALNFMLNKNKFIYDYYKENDYSDFQFISSWEKNYKSWIKNKDFPIKLIKYEDLIDQTFYVVKDLINFINKTCKLSNNFDKSKAQNAIETTSFEKLKKIENNHGFSESIKSKNRDKNKVPFFHLGPNNNWQKIFDPSFANKLNTIFKETLEELQYH